MLTKRQYVFRSLWFYWRPNLGIVLGAALAAAVLNGALMVGDSVRYSLEQITLSRLGQTDFVMRSADRFFKADLAARMQDGDSTLAAVLLLDGVALSPQGDWRINAVQVVGVDDAFWALAPQPTAPHWLDPGACLVNQAFADRMSAAAEDAFVLRVRKPGGLPVDMALASKEADAWSRRLHIEGVLDRSSFGNFSLQTSQITVPTVFVSRAWLSEQLDIEGRANVLLVKHAGASREVLQERLDAQWRLDDACLLFKALPDGTVELQSRRIFIAAPVAEAGTAIAGCQPVITYFVNRIATQTQATPYSFATAPGSPRVPDSLADNEVLINDWLANDLQAAVGDPVTLTFYAIDSGSQLVEKSETFMVAGILPVSEVAASDRTLTPDMPGLSEVENCRDWDPGIPLDLGRLRDQDETYWNAYGPLPKVYLTASAAARLWTNRFGRYTALRFPRAAGDAAAVASTLKHRLHARELGFVFVAAKADALTASRNAVDFGQLFLGLSFFLMAAAVLLTVLLFAFNVQSRARTMGSLRALGFRPWSIARLFLAEGLVLVIAGTLCGSALAAGYNALVLRGLETLWNDAVRTSAFQMHIRPVSVFIGAPVVILAAVAGMVLTLCRQMRLTITELQHGGQDEPANQSTGRVTLAAGCAGLLLAIGLVVSVPAGQGQEAMGVFFGSSSLLMLSLLFFCHSGMSALQRAASASAPGRGMLVLRSVALRRSRSLACITLLALGVFLVIAVAANRRGPVRNPDHPACGTGGYRLWAQTTLPVLYDLNDARGQSAFGLSSNITATSAFTPLQWHRGDDASCLNLNRIAQPHMLGVAPVEFDRRGSFTFAQRADGVDPEHPWLALEQKTEEDVIPAVADQSDIVWGMGKSIGDTLTYTDEQGRPFRVRLIGGLSGSILQGHIVISARHMQERFPSQGGAYVLLVQTPAANEQQIQSELTQKLSDLGLSCMTTRQRLAQFNSVENTYLSIFMMLGALGLLTGSAGMGIVAARNILERRAGLALMRAVGFRRRTVHRLVVAEHAILATCGVIIGGASALLAVAPALLTPGSDIPWGGVLLTLAAILAGSLLWIALAVYSALSGRLTESLRDE